MGYGITVYAKYFKAIAEENTIQFFSYYVLGLL